MVDTRDPARLPRLIGRAEEQSALASVLAATTARRASVLIVRGLAGQGKTTLLDWLAEQACHEGVTVLRTTGVEFEMGVAYSGLTAVLRPIIGHLDALPPALSGALRGALDLSPEDATTLATYSATLALLSAAEETRTLVLVDDAHWVDHSSLEALLFAAHRCDADRVGFVFAQRSGMPCLVDQARFPVVELGGLDPAAATELLAQFDVVPDVAQRCWERTDGNPMALIEGAKGLTADQRSGRSPLPVVLPVAEGLLDAFRGQLSAMRSSVLQALRVAALEGDNDINVIAAGVQLLGGDIEDLTTAEHGGLVVVVDGRVRWRHPVLRAAVSAGMTASERRRVHRALAEVMTEVGQVDRAVWHMSESVVGLDDAVAGRLAETAAAARRRGALALAADAYAHAAKLAANQDARVRCTLAAADARLICCDFQGVVDTAAPLLDHADDPVVRARAALVSGQAETWLTGPAQSARRMEASAATVTERAADVAALLLLQAAIARLLALDIDGATHAAEAAATTAESVDDPAVLFAAYAVRSLAQFFGGGGASAALALDPIAQIVSGNLDKVDEGVATIAQLCAFAQITGGESEAAIDLLRLVIDNGDVAGIVGTAALARVILGEALWRVGRWSESLAELSHLWSLQEAMGQTHIIACASSVLARIEAGLGQADTCRRHASDALEATQRLGLTQLWLVSWSALGLLELGAGRHGEAAAAFDHLMARDTSPEPGWLWWQADAVEAFLGCGRRDSAQAVLDRLECQYDATGRTWAGAAADRCAGLLGNAEGADERFESALIGFRTLRAPFEEARTLLLRGKSRLNRGGHRDGAVDLATARTIFDRLGARAWSEQASVLRGEISADSPSLASKLTPAELRVALTVGRGASNREAAERLFISVKTVDHHLQRTYRKLGLRRRSQLAAVVAADGEIAS
jgi:DNA-binding CsgD family transcriptional regulator